MKKKQGNGGALAQFRFLTDVIEKLDDQVILLAMGLSLIIALIIVENPQPPTWISQTLISIFLIATAHSCFREAIFEKKPIHNLAIEVEIKERLPICEDCLRFICEEE